MAPGAKETVAAGTVPALPEENIIFCVPNQLLALIHKSIRHEISPFQ
jgi:hypothetical protein